MSVDLTHSIETGMQTYPDDPTVEVQDHASHDADGYRVEALEREIDGGGTATADGSAVGDAVDASDSEGQDRADPPEQ